MPQVFTPDRDPPLPRGLSAGRSGGRHPRLEALFADYAEAHRNPANRLCHEVAIPFIALTTIAMLDWIPLGELGGHRVTAAVAAWAALATWYIWMDAGLGTGIAALLVACVPIGRGLHPTAVVAIAAAAWTLQLVGDHAFERKPPSLPAALRHVLVGPAFFLAVMADIGRGRPAP